MELERFIIVGEDNRWNDSRERQAAVTRLFIFIIELFFISSYECENKQISWIN
jgi:hypothetical protein